MGFDLPISEVHKPRAPRCRGPPPHTHTHTQWSLISVDTQYGACFVSPFWRYTEITTLPLAVRQRKSLITRGLQHTSHTVRYPYSFTEVDQLEI
jgi:hypothetical protein